MRAQDPELAPFTLPSPPGRAVSLVSSYSSDITSMHELVPEWAALAPRPGGLGRRLHPCDPTEATSADLGYSE